MQIPIFCAEDDSESLFSFLLQHCSCLLERSAGLALSGQKLSCCRCFSFSTSGSLLFNHKHPKKRNNCVDTISIAALDTGESVDWKSAMPADSPAAVGSPSHSKEHSSDVPAAPSSTLENAFQSWAGDLGEFARWDTRKEVRRRRSFRISGHDDTHSDRSGILTSPWKICIFVWMSSRTS